MLLSLPPPPPWGLSQYLTRFIQTLVQALSPVVSQTEAARQIILQSPNGTNYSVTVSDVGALVVAGISGKTPF